MHRQGSYSNDVGSASSIPTWMMATSGDEQRGGCDRDEIRHREVAGAHQEGPTGATRCHRFVEADRWIDDRHVESLREGAGRPRSPAVNDKRALDACDAAQREHAGPEFVDRRCGGIDHGSDVRHRRVRRDDNADRRMSGRTDPSGEDHHGHEFCHEEDARGQSVGATQREPDAPHQVEERPHQRHVGRETYHAFVHRCRASKWIHRHPVGGTAPNSSTCVPLLPVGIAPKRQRHPGRGAVLAPSRRRAIS